MSAVFPGGVFSTNTKVSGNTIQPSHINNLQDEITAIESAILSSGLAFKTVCAVRAELTSNTMMAVSSGVSVLQGVSFTDPDTFDTANMHDPSVNSSIVHVPFAGYYQVSAQCRWKAASTLGFRQLRINLRTPAHGYGQVTMSQIGPGDCLSTGTVAQTVTDVIYAPSTSHYISVDIAQGSGSTTTLEVATVSVAFLGQ